VAQAYDRPAALAIGSSPYARSRLRMPGPTSISRRASRGGEHRGALVARVLHELAAAGWRLEAAITDNGSEFRAGLFTSRLERLGHEHEQRGGRAEEGEQGVEAPKPNACPVRPTRMGACQPKPASR
jgi:hypothetical protein